MSGGWQRRQGRERWARLRGLLVAGVVAAAGGCDVTDPFVYKYDEFNRESPRFNKPRQEGEAVYVCYNGIGTTDLTVQRIADAECAKLGRAAARIDGEYGTCPLLTPRAAIFRCDDVAADSPAGVPATPGDDPTAAAGAP